MTTKSSSLRTAIPFLLALAWPGAAFAADCNDDADCGEGFYCAKGASSPGCDPSGDCPAPDVVEEGVGTCEAAPVTCDSDADCGEYLSCQASADGVCWADTDGQSGCTEPDPNAPKYCAVASTACSTDADCPREFECVTYDSPCPGVPCADNDPDCKACEPSTSQVCQPKQIECASDGDCPADWSCASVYSGGGGSDVAEPAPGEPRPAAAMPESDDTTTGSEQRFCFPDAWGGPVYATGDGAPVAGNDSSAESDSRGAPSSSSGSGGCSLTAAGVATGGSWSLMLLGLAPWVRRRLRRA
jgi:hypothetical protein